MLDWWQRRQPQAKLVTIGTSCSYSPDLPMTEANYLQGDPIDSLFAYAHTKRMLLVGQIALARQYWPEVGDPGAVNPLGPDTIPTAGRWISFLT